MIGDDKRKNSDRRRIGLERRATDWTVRGQSEGRDAKIPQRGNSCSRTDSNER
jgi:hypothetical protein